jgi:hypothetical protein
MVTYYQCGSDETAAAAVHSPIPARLQFRIADRGILEISVSI